MSDTLNIEKPYLVIKRVHLYIGLAIMLIGAGAQIGLAIARMDLSTRLTAVEVNQIGIEGLRKDVQALNVEAGKLRTEIEAFRRELEKQR